MVKKLLKRIMGWMPYVVVTIVTAWTGVKNWPTHGTILGWDNLMTQFDITMNIGRELSGVWQEYQGLGLLAGMAHASDLVRLCLQWLASLFLPANWIRPLEIFTMLLLGSWGVVRLLQYWTERNNNFVINIAPVVGGLFYLLNIGTVQNFWVPFEPYFWAFGMVPWLVFSFNKYLDGGRRRDLVFFGLISLLATPLAYLQTVYVVYGITLLLFGAGWIAVNAKRSLGLKKLLRRVALPIFVSLSVNAFWLLPQAYFFVTSVGVTTEAKMNTIATQEVGLSNNANGGLLSVLKMDGYWLQLHDYQQGGGFEYLMSPWVDHLSNGWVDYARDLTVVFVLLGLIMLTWRKDKRAISLWILFVGFIALMQGNNLPFGYLNTLMYRLLPVLSQIFRSPFTKVIVFWVFLQSLFFAYGVSYTANWFIERKNKIFKALGVLLVGIALVVSGIVVLPVFRGQLVYQRMIQKLPAEYFDLFNFFHGVSSDSRIAKLPVDTFWGWGYNDWGYDGSGFLWYGIEQPILDRAFDVWSPYNEGFYNEFSTALYGVPMLSGSSPSPDQIRDDTADLESVSAVSDVLEKYDVRYVLLDESVITPGQGKEILRIDETKKIAEELRWKQVWQEGFLTVWEVPQGHSDKVTQFISAPESYIWVEADTEKVRRDVVWEDVGTYVQSPGEDSPFAGWRTLLGLQPRIPFKETPLVAYPFAGLMRESVDNVEYTDTGVKISSVADLTSQLVVPGFDQGQEVNVVYNLSLVKNKLSIEWEPSYYVNGEGGPKLENKVEEILDYRDGVWVVVNGDNSSVVYLKDGDTAREQATIAVDAPFEVNVYSGDSRQEEVGGAWNIAYLQQCWSGVEGATASAQINEKNEMKFEIQNVAGCLSIPLDESNKDELIQTIATYKSETGTRPQFCMDREGEPYQCENEDVWSTTPTSRDWSWVMRTVEASKGDRYWLDLSAKPNGEGNESITYKIPQVYHYPLLTTLKIESQDWMQYMNEVRLDIEQNNLVVEVPSKAQIYDLSTLGRYDSFNCDVLKRGNVEKNGDIYIADNYGSLCDYINLVGITSGNSYLMRVKGEDVEGRSLKFFLHNTYSKRNDLEELLPSAKFDKTYSLLPWNYSGEYLLNTETRSFGQEVVNKLDPVGLRSVPIGILARAKIVNSNQETVISKKNNLQVRDVRKTGTWLYKVTSSGNGLLKLSQGYDSGWVGVQMTNHKLSNSQIMEHVKVNGWANGWLRLAEPNLAERGGLSDSTTIYLIYWPQLLEYLGFVLMGATFVWILRKNRGK